MEYERTHAVRTQIYDDSTDWFRESGNRWLSAADRATAQAKAQHQLDERRKGRRRQQQLAIDIARGTVQLQTAVAEEAEEEGAVDRFLMEARERQLQDVADTSDFRQFIFGTSHLRYGDTTFDGKERQVPKNTPELSDACRAVYDALRSRMRHVRCCMPIIQRDSVGVEAPGRR